MEVVAIEVEDDKQGKSLPWVWGSIDRRVQLVSDVVGLKRMCPLVLAQNSHSNKGNPWWKMMVHRVVGGSIVVAEFVGYTMRPVLNTKFAQSIIKPMLHNCSPL